jgi:flagellar biosynthesis anti-sigma factor FlgM
MVGMNGIIGVPGPANTSQPKARGSVSGSRGSLARDSVDFSSQAQEASRTAQLLEQARAESEVRAERVAKAKENIENGTYKMQGVVRIVASRVSKYIYEDA